FLERITFVAVTQYLEEQSGGPLLAFSRSFFNKAPNLNANSLSTLIARFGPDHQTRFEAFLTTTLKDSLNDLASVRNPIAHGLVTGGRKLNPERYFKLCGKIYGWLTSEFVQPVGHVIHYPQHSR